MRTEGISADRVKGCTSGNVVRLFDIYESELRNVNHPVHRIFSVDETRITKMQHRHIKVASMVDKKEIVSNIGRKGKSNHCCRLYECHWNIHSTMKCVPKKKYEIKAYGWSTGGLNFGFPSKWLNSDGYIY